MSVKKYSEEVEFLDQLFDNIYGLILIDGSINSLLFGNPKDIKTNVLEDKLIPTDLIIKNFFSKLWIILDENILNESNNKTFLLNEFKNLFKTYEKLENFLTFEYIHDEFYLFFKNRLINETIKEVNEIYRRNFKRNFFNLTYDNYLTLSYEENEKIIKNHKKYQKKIIEILEGKFSYKKISRNYKSKTIERKYKNKTIYEIYEILEENDYELYISEDVLKELYFRDLKKDQALKRKLIIEYIKKKCF